MYKSITMNFEVIIYNQSSKTFPEAVIEGTGLLSLLNGARPIASLINLWIFLKKFTIKISALGMISNLDHYRISFLRPRLYLHYIS